MSHCSSSLEDGEIRDFIIDDFNQQSVSNFGQRNTTEDNYESVNMDIDSETGTKIRYYLWDFTKIFFFRTFLEVSQPHSENFTEKDLLWNDMLRDVSNA